MNKTKLTHDQFIAYALEGFEPEHDDLMDAEDFDRRRAQRDGWETATWDGRW